MLDGNYIGSLANRLLAAAPPGSQVVLFGSYARGTATADSDVDFLVIEPEVTDRHQEMVRLRRALKGTPVGVDVLVVSNDLYANSRQTPSNIYYDIWKEGRVFNGA